MYVVGVWTVASKGQMVMGGTKETMNTLTARTRGSRIYKTTYEGVERNGPVRNGPQRSGGSIKLARIAYQQRKQNTYEETS